MSAQPQPQPQPAPGIRRQLEGLQLTGAAVLLEVRGHAVPAVGHIVHVSRHAVTLQEGPTLPLRDVRGWRAAGRA